MLKLALQIVNANLFYLIALAYLHAPFLSLTVIADVVAQPFLG